MQKCKYIHGQRPVKMQKGCILFIVRLLFSVTQHTSAAATNQLNCRYSHRQPILSFYSVL